MPKLNDSVLFSLNDRLTFARIGKGNLVTMDEEFTAGETLDDALVKGVVTFLINRTQPNDKFPVM